MMKLKRIVTTLCLFACLSVTGHSQQADRTDYLSGVKTELQKVWPENRTVNVVFHGHSVPSGYANTPRVNTLTAYPHLTLHAIKKYYPNAVVNVITTSIGGEQSEQGARRFKKEVLTHCPDVLIIDYALNDRSIGLERAYKAWSAMIEQALKRGVKVILCTPTPDLTEDIRKEDTPLSLHARQVRELAAKYKVGLVDSYALFARLQSEGRELKDYMSQSNHPNEKGHEVVTSLIEEWFKP